MILIAFTIELFKLEPKDLYYRFLRDSFLPLLVLEISASVVEMVLLLMPSIMSCNGERPDPVASSVWNWTFSVGLIASVMHFVLGILCGLLGYFLVCADEFEGRDAKYAFMMCSRASMVWTFASWYAF